MSTPRVSDLFAKLFIARRDVKAVQKPSGAWSPHERRDEMGEVVERYPWTRADLESHIAGTSTFGHYLLDKEDHTKLFAFDIDLEKPNSARGITFHYPSSIEGDAWGGEPVEFDPREAWLQRAHPSRPFLKYKLKMTAHSIARVIVEELELPCAVTYSGGKGLHVYAFTGSIDAAEAREGARIVMEQLGTWAPSRGDNFYQHVDRNYLTGYPLLSIETFPKQDSLKDKDLGNLMRLPLGRNLKSKDPTFFVDMTTAMAEIKPVDPVWALTEGLTRPWSRT